MLWNPEFGAEVTYQENAPPLAILPKIVMHQADKVVLKEGWVTVEIDENFQDEADSLDIDLKIAPTCSSQRTRTRFCAAKTSARSW